MAESFAHLENICNALFNKLEKDNIPHRLDRSQSQTIGTLYHDYHENAILQHKFSSFFDFLNELLAWSYGLQLNVEAALKGRPTFTEVTPLPDQFSGKVDLFCLIDVTYQEYEIKNKQYNFQKKRKVLIDGKKKLLVASFNDNFWDNIYNDFDSYEGGDGKDICIFNRSKHSIGSYLHCAEANVNYLDIKSDELDLNPICRAILLLGFGVGGYSKKHANSRPSRYVVVDGVLGNFVDLEDSAKREVYKLMWDSIRSFSFKRKFNVLLNTFHSVNQPEPDEFVEFVKNVERKKIFEEMSVHEENGIQYTHELVFLDNSDIVQRCSNMDKERFFYHGEQYSDTFHAINKSLLPKAGHPGSFFKLGGYVKCLEFKNVESPEAHKRTRIQGCLILSIASILMLGKCYSCLTGTETLGGRKVNNYYTYMDTAGEKQLPHLRQEIEETAWHECSGYLSGEFLVCKAEHNCASRYQDECLKGTIDVEIPLRSIVNVSYVTKGFFGYPCLQVSIDHLRNGRVDNLPLAPIKLRTEEGAKHLIRLISRNPVDKQRDGE